MDPAVAAFEEGNEEFVKENWQAALQSFSKACELNPQQPDYLLHKAAALSKLSRHGEAIVVCDEAIKLDPKSAKAFLRKGMALLNSGNGDQARVVLEQGAAIDPDNKSFASWLKKCPPPAAGTNLEIGKHDQVLGALLEAHNRQGAAVLETVMEHLSRETQLFTMPGNTAQEIVSSLAAKYAAAAQGAGGAAAAAAAGAAAGAAGAAGAGGLMQMEVIVSASAKNALAKAVKAREEEQADTADDGSVKVGTQCKNNACQKTYQDESSLTQPCVYHPGAPVFHEGYKFWSCCKKKRTTEFSEFISFTGCTTGTCTFQEDPTKKKKALCRWDFFQQGPNVVVSIYAKKVHPEQCSFLISNRQLRLSIMFDFVNSFSLDVLLSGAVNPAACKVEILAPKVEITLKKADGASWSELGTDRKSVV